MCGICGVIQLSTPAREVVSPDVLNRMTDAMLHRGPNDRGTFAEPGAALGVRRLSIVDVDGGHQPFGDETGRIWAVQNGELYNHDEIRTRLLAQGHRFRSRCDTEILPHLYEEAGAGFPAQLRGKFGVAVWDGAKGRAVVARDRLGVKPLYYARAGDLLVFASELKSLLASGLVDTELDLEAIDAFLSLGFFPAPATPLRAVRKLPPGHLLVAGPEGMRIERYWAYPHPEPRPMTSEEASEQLLAALDEAVRLRLMSDVPLGAMLSGGLDSSVVVGLMARHMGEPVKTFSVGFVEDERGNELADARSVAAHFGADHHELELSFREHALDFEQLVWHLDEPVADLSAVGFLAISELAARHVTVALSGQGADELLGGYRKHRAAALAGRFLRLPRPVQRAALAAAHVAPASVARPARTLAARNGAQRHLAMSGRVDPALRRSLVRGPLAELDGDAGLRAVERWTEGLTEDPLQAALYLDGNLALADDLLHYFDRASMAHSLEVRVPFLDHEVVELCARIPSDLKVRRLTTKYVLREAARGLVPPGVLRKRKVGFFSEAIDGWFRAQSRGLVSDYLLGPEPRYGDLLDRAAVGRLVSQHAASTGTGVRSGRLLVALLMLEIWLSSFLPRALAGNASERPLVTL